MWPCWYQFYLLFLVCPNFIAHLVPVSRQDFNPTPSMSTASQTYFRWLYQQQVIKYCRVAPISIWVLDYFLTLDDEIRLLSVGYQNWSLAHLLYMPTRYFPIVGSLCSAYNALQRIHIEPTCVALYRTAEIVLSFAMVASEGLLLIRTLAFLNNQRVARRVLIGMYCVVAIVILVCGAISCALKFQAICAETTSSVTTQLATQLSHVTVGMFTSAAFFELAIIICTILCGLPLRGRSQNTIISTLTRGNLLYGFALFTTSIVTITFFVLPLQDGWNGLFITFQGVLHSVMASRVLFDLRRTRGQITLPTFTKSSVVFAPGHIGGDKTDRDMVDVDILSGDGPKT